MFCLLHNLRRVIGNIAFPFWGSFEVAWCGEAKKMGKRVGGTNHAFASSIDSDYGISPEGY